MLIMFQRFEHNTENITYKTTHKSFPGALFPSANFLVSKIKRLCNLNILRDLFLEIKNVLVCNSLTIFNFVFLN